MTDDPGDKKPETVKRDSKGRWLPNTGSPHPGGNRKGRKRDALVSHFPPDTAGKLVAKLTGLIEADDLEAIKYTASLWPKPKPLGRCYSVDVAPDASPAERAEAVTRDLLAGAIPVDEGSALLQGIRASQEISDLDAIRAELAELKELVKRR